MQKKEFKKKDVLKKISLIDSHKKEQLIHYFLDNSRVIYKLIYKKWKLAFTAFKTPKSNGYRLSPTFNDKANTHNLAPKFVIQRSATTFLIPPEMQTNPPKRQFLPTSSDLNKLLLRGIECSVPDQKEIMFLDSFFLTS